MKSKDSKPAEWYELACKGYDRVVPDETWYKQCFVPQKCPVSPERRPEYAGRSIDVLLKSAPRVQTFQKIEGTLLCVANRQFLERLGACSALGFSLGRVVSVTKGELTDICTFVGDRILPIRGGPTSTYRVCTVCGQHIYFPMPFGYEYILRSDLVVNQEIYAAANGGCIISSRLSQRITSGEKRTLHITPLLLRDEPDDGFASISLTPL